MLRRRSSNPGSPPICDRMQSCFGILIQQQDSDVLQMEVVTRNDQDALQHFVQVKSGQHRLAGVVKYGDFLHVPRWIVTRTEGWPRFRK